MSASCDMEHDIVTEMKGVGIELSPEMLSKCIAIATNHQLSGNDMATEWEVLAMNRKYDALTNDTFASFRSALLNSHKKKKSTTTTKKKMMSVTPTKRERERERAKAAVVSRPAFSNRSHSEFETEIGTPEKRQKINVDANSNANANANANPAIPVSTPPRAKKGEASASSASSAVVTPSTTGTGTGTAPTTTTSSSSSSVKSSSIPSYAHRKNAGQTVLCYNPKHLSSGTNAGQGQGQGQGRKCTIHTQPFGTNVSSTYRHMTDRRRHTYLNDQLERKMREMVHLFQIPTHNMEGDDDYENVHEQQQQQQQQSEDEKENENAWPPLEHVGVPRPTPQTNIGRICNEAHSGKLHPTSILLEGCFTGSHGARIELDISQLSDVSLFPGQIVAVAGYNSSGRRMVAQRLVEGTGMGMSMGMGKGMGASRKSEKDVRGRQETMDEEEEEKKGQDGIERFQHATTMKQDLHHMQYGMEVGCQRGEPIQIMAVAGPYTTQDNVSYQPFVDLLEVIVNGTSTTATTGDVGGAPEASPPDVVILMGPFVDMRQETIKEGTGLIVEYETDETDGNGEPKMEQVHVSYEHFFAHKIANELEMLYEENPDLKTQFVIVPSLDDAVAEPVFPQPPLEDSLPNGGRVVKNFVETEETPFGSLCLNRIESAGRNTRKVGNHNKRIHLVSNPATIAINEVTIGFTSTDSFLHLSTESVNQTLPPGTRLTRLSKHVLQQQSYYPIYPPPCGGGRDVNVDVTQMDKYRIPVKPDVLILPSRLTPMAMNLNNGNAKNGSGEGTGTETVVVNPGLLVKGTAGGTFAIMDIHPTDENDLKAAAEERMDHRVHDRIRIEVRRI